MADFRKLRDSLRQEDKAFESEETRGPKRRPAGDTFRYNMVLVLPALVVLAAAPVIGWLVLDQQQQDARAISAVSLDQGRAAEVLPDPATDHLEQRVSRLNENLEALSGMMATLESKLLTTDALEERVIGLTENLEAVSKLTGELESRQVAADQLEARITQISGQLEQLNDQTEDLQSRRAAADTLAERIDVINQKMLLLNGAVDELEARQAAADRLEGQVAGIRDEMTVLKELAAELEPETLTEPSPALVSLPGQEPPVANNGETALVAAVQATRPETSPAPSDRAVQGNQGNSTADTTPESAPVIAIPAPARQPWPAATNHGAMTIARADATGDTAPGAVAGKRGERAGVETPVGGPWRVNLISTLSNTEANNFSRRAKSKGIQAEIQSVTVRGTPYWRVQIPGFASRASAVAHAESVKAAMGLRDTWIYHE